MKREYAQLSAGGLASKLLGGLREILLARYFGTGYVADAYRASLSLTLSPAHLVTSRVVQTCFIPLYARYAEREKEKGRALFHSLLGVFLALGIALGILLALIAPLLVSLLLPGFDPDRAALAARMLRVMAIGVPFYIYSSVLGALGAAERDFVIPALRPGIQNLGMLAFIALAAWRKEPAIAAWGFTAAYGALSLYATAHLAARGLLPTRPALDRDVLGEVWGKLWELLRPLVLLSFLIEGNILVERYVASLLGAGRVAAIDYARYVTETLHFLLAVPIGIIGLSFFASLSEEEMGPKIDRILAILAVALMPLTGYLLANGREALALLYMRGSFDAMSLSLTESALRGFSVGLWIFSASYTLQRILNARLRNSVVLRAETLSIALNVAFNLLLFRQLGVLVIGLGVAVGSLGSLLVYLSHLKLRLPLARRGLLVTLIALPVYLLLDRFLGRPLGGSIGAFALRTLGAAAFWGIVVGSVPDLRRLVLEKLKRARA